MYQGGMSLDDIVLAEGVSKQTVRKYLARTSFYKTRLPRRPDGRIQKPSARTLEKEKEIAGLYRSGRTAVEIASQMKMSRQMVYNYLDAAGVVPNDRPRTCGKCKNILSVDHFHQKRNGLRSSQCISCREKNRQ